MEKELGAPGDFAQVYVIANDVGHHVQKMLGKTDEVNRLRGQLPPAEYNHDSVMLELQDDIYTGVMFHHSQRQMKIVGASDIEEGIQTASAIGDDTLQKRSQGYANQETFTHRSSAQ